MSKLVDAQELYQEFQKIRLNVDETKTPHLSKIKEIIKRIHFANIINKQQALDNTGDALYKIYDKDESSYFNNLTLSYTIEAGKTGVVYGTFKEEADKDGLKKVIFKGEGKANHFNNYARFMVDIVSKKVIYSKEFERFVIVGQNSFKVLDPITFRLEYPVDKNHHIADFLEVMEKIYGSIINVRTHDYEINRYAFAGKDWVYDAKALVLVDYVPTDKQLYFNYYDVTKAELDCSKARELLNAVADDDKSKNNLSLLHAYTLYRKLDLIHPEYYFILKDFGRTGKGLFMNTFNSVFTVNKVNFDNLIGGGFEANNEWFNFYNTDVAHANETGEINNNSMRVLRKIATCEPVTGREIGKDSIKFNIRSVLILDTNENVDTGEMTANKSRTVKASFKDRPRNETDAERHAFFKPYWAFVQPNGETSVSASISFLINSLDCLRSKNGQFSFDDVTLKNYFSADDLTETQKLIVTTIDKDGFIFASDELLQKTVAEDYGSFRYNNAKKDIKNIGVKLNKPKKIDGQVFKVHVEDNKALFKQATLLLNNE